MTTRFGIGRTKVAVAGSVVLVLTLLVFLLALYNPVPNSTTFSSTGVSSIQVSPQTSKEKVNQTVILTFTAQNISFQNLTITADSALPLISPSSFLSVQVKACHHLGGNYTCLYQIPSATDVNSTVFYHFVGTGFRITTTTAYLFDFKALANGTYTINFLIDGQKFQSTVNVE